MQFARLCYRLDLSWWRLFYTLCCQGLLRIIIYKIMSQSRRFDFSDIKSTFESNMCVLCYTDPILLWLDASLFVCTETTDSGANTHLHSNDLLQLSQLVNITFSYCNFETIISLSTYISYCFTGTTKRIIFFHCIACLALINRIRRNNAHLLNS